MATKQIIQMKKSVYKTLLRLQRMDVNVSDYLDELRPKFEKPEKKQNKIKRKKISLLVEDKIGWGWCDKGHQVFHARGTRWKTKKCAGCGTNKTPKVYKCFSCSDYDKNYNKKKFDQTGKKYLWCDKCVKKTNPKNVRAQIKANSNNKKQIIQTLTNDTKNGVDILTGLNKKNALKYLLNEICLNQNKRKFALYLFEIDEIFKVNEKRLTYIGQILTSFEQKSEQNWREEGVPLQRVWSFRVGGNKFAIVTQTRHEISQQEAFYLALDEEIKLLDICMSAGVCCLGLESASFMPGGQYNEQSQTHSFFEHPLQSSRIKKAAHWLLFAGKALNDAKHDGGDCYRIYDDSQVQVVQQFIDC